MRKVILLMHVSLDGFTAGPNGEMDWIITDDEIFKDAINLSETVDTAIYGRVTYQLMESYWPKVLTKPSVSKDALHHAQWVENVQKVVLSRTLNKVEWNNTILIKDNFAEEILKLKQNSGRNMMIFGSPGIVPAFMKYNLIDEFRINVNPIIVGNGIPLFEDISNRVNLNLINIKTFTSGVVGLHYETIQNIPTNREEINE